MQQAAALLRGARKPFVIAGGGVLYSEAEQELLAFCAAYGVPVGETQAATGHGGSGTEESRAAGVNVDLMAVVRASRAAQPFPTRERGANIINIASGSGLNPSPRSPAYGAAKAAAIHYTRTQAATLAASGIRVNCIAPGSIEFPGGVWDVRKTENPTLYNATLANCPMGRMGKAEEVADVAVFLASPRASWITAQAIGVNGGQGLRGARAAGSRRP